MPDNTIAMIMSLKLTVNDGYNNRVPINVLLRKKKVGFMFLLWWDQDSLTEWLVGLGHKIWSVKIHCLRQPKWWPNSHKRKDSWTALGNTMDHAWLAAQFWRRAGAEKERRIRKSSPGQRWRWQWRSVGDWPQFSRRLTVSPSPPSSSSVNHLTWPHSRAGSDCTSSSSSLVGSMLVR